MTKNSLLLVAVLSIFLATSIHSSTVSAATSGVSLSPFQQTIALQPTETERTFDLTLTNHTTSIQELLLSVRDFGSLNETGGLLFEGASTYTQKYGLASWMTLGTDTVILQPEEAAVVPVTVTNRDTLQPGGHYGAVVATVNSLDPQTGNRVVINQQLVSLVMVDKVGGEHYNLKLVGLTQNGNWLHLPTITHVRFQNPGNVHVIPRGLVQLVSPTGDVIAQGIINSESAFVLPESYRELTVPLTAVAGSSTLPGVYRIKVSYRYEGVTTSAHKSYLVKFINVPGLIVLAILIVAAGMWAFKLGRKKARKKSHKPQKTA